MARKHLSYYLEDFSRLEEITLEDLQNWQGEYPYVQNLQFLVAKKKQQISENPDQNTLQMASMYSVDRNYLYQKLSQDQPEKKMAKTDVKVKVAASTGAAAAATAIAVKSSDTDKKETKVKKYTLEDRKTTKKETSKSKKKTAKKKVKKPNLKKEKSKEKSSAKKNTAPKKKLNQKKKSINLKFQNLKKIEGIGPKIEQLLYSSNIRTYKQLASCSETRLKKALLKGGSKYKSHNPTTWPQQAKLAADDKWTALQKLQDKIQGGKIQPTKKTKTVSKSKAITKKAKPAIKKLKKVAAAPVKKKSKKAPAKSKAQVAKKAKTTKKESPKTKSKSKKQSVKKTAPKKKRSTSKKVIAKKTKSKSSTSKKPATKKKVVKAKNSSKASKKSRSSKKTDEVSSFSQWLLSLRSEEKKQRKPSTSKKKKTTKASSKIERKIKSSLKDKDEVISESLAKLLAKQGHTSKARAMYKKLSLLFPQKSAYFAAQIEKLKSNK